MASILGIDTIQNQSGTTAMTISNTGTISEPNRPCFCVSSATNQTIPDAVITKIIFGNDTDGGNGGRNINKQGLYSNSRFTVTSATTGVYYFWTNMLFLGGGDISDMYLYWYKNGVSQSLNYHNAGYGNNLRYGVINAMTMMNLDTAGDYMECHLYANTASGTVVLDQGNDTTSSRVLMGGYKVA